MPSFLSRRVETIHECLPKAKAVLEVIMCIIHALLLIVCIDCLIKDCV